MKMKRLLCKAIIGKKNSSNTVVDWITSKRTILKVMDDKLICAGHEILFSDIESASLRKVPSAFFIPGGILSVQTTSGEGYHFGVIYSDYFKNGLPFPVNYSVENVPGIWIRRMIVFSSISYIFWATVLH